MQRSTVYALIAALLLFGVSTSATAAAAPSGATFSLRSALGEVIQVKHGGHGHGWGRGHGWGPPGFRGRHCPPGHWKKGWC